jgi:hypothetical protein
MLTRFWLSFLELTAVKLAITLLTCEISFTTIAAQPWMMFGCNSSAWGLAELKTEELRLLAVAELLLTVVFLWFWGKLRRSLSFTAGQLLLLQKKGAEAPQRLASKNDPKPTQPRPTNRTNHHHRRHNNRN